MFLSPRHSPSSLLTRSRTKRRRRKSGFAPKAYRLRLETLESRVVLSANFVFAAPPVMCTCSAFTDVQDVALDSDMDTDAGQDTFNTLNIAGNSSRPSVGEGPFISTTLTPDSFDSQPFSSGVDSARSGDSDSMDFMDSILDSQSFNLTLLGGTSKYENPTRVDTIVVQQVGESPDSSLLASHSLDVGLDQSSSSFSLGPTYASHPLGTTNSFGLVSDTSHSSSIVTESYTVSTDSQSLGSRVEHYSGEGGGQSLSIGPEYGVESTYVVTGLPQAALSGSTLGEVIANTGDSNSTSDSVASGTSSGDVYTVAEAAESSDQSNQSEAVPLTLDVAANHAKRSSNPHQQSAGFTYATHQGHADDSSHALAMARQQRFVMASDRLRTRANQTTPNVGDTSLNSSPATSSRSTATQSTQMREATDLAIAATYGRGGRANGPAARIDRSSPEIGLSTGGSDALADSPANQVTREFEWSLDLLVAGSLFGALAIWQRPIISKRTAAIQQLLE